MLRGQLVLRSGLARREHFGHRDLRSASLSRWYAHLLAPVDTQVAMLKTVQSKADINSTNVIVLPIRGAPQPKGCGDCE